MFVFGGGGYWGQFLIQLSRVGAGGKLEMDEDDEFVGVSSGFRVQRGPVRPGAI